jgi:hypothetical protein
MMADIQPGTAAYDALVAENLAKFRAMAATPEAKEDYARAVAATVRQLAGQAVATEERE